MAVAAIPVWRNKARWPAGGREMRWTGLACFWALHVALALAMRRNPVLATPVGMLALLLCLSLALLGERAYVVLAAAGYIAGSEVLWRMCGAALPWEAGKYALGAVFVIGLTRIQRARMPEWALLYLLLLLPGAALSWTALDAESFREAVAFNLSGAAALVAGICCCSNLRVTRGELWRALLAALGPMAGVAAIAMSATFAGASIQFGRHANFATSGGFGPNQVSASLGLAALLASLSVVLVRSGSGRAMVLLAAAAAFATQSALTFSRGGLYASGGSLVAAAASATGRARRRVVALVCGLVAACALVLGPAANRFTGGRLAQRFGEVNMSGREQIAAVDLALWAAHPVWGVGVGLSKFRHPREAAAHTEFTRLLAEHGIFGLLGLLLLLWEVMRRAAVAPRRDRPLLAALIVWALLYMLANGMRLAAPAFALSLVFVNVRAGGACARAWRPQ